MTELDPCIAQVVDLACRDLFSHYEVPLQAVTGGAPAPTADLAFCGVIGFSGDDLRGTLMLACSREPLVAGEPSDRAVRDWLAELTNQLLGRIKTQLTTRGALIHGSTPLVIRGDHLAPMSSRARLPHLFTANGGLVAVWFEAEARPDLVLAPSPDRAATVFEGETLFF